MAKSDLTNQKIEYEHGGCKITNARPSVKAKPSKGTTREYESVRLRFPYHGHARMVIGNLSGKINTPLSNKHKGHKDHIYQDEAE